MAKVPVKYSPQIENEIINRMADGESLRSICRGDNMPSAAAVIAWTVDREGFGERYARAREAQAHALADDLLDIADDGSNDWMASNASGNPGYELNGEHVQRSRLRLDARKWLASKILPKVYGDRQQNQQLDKDGNPTDPVAPVLNLTVARE